MEPATGDGIVNRTAAGPVDEVVTKIEALLNARGVTLFAVVDHSGEAARAGLTMRPTKLLIFGNPKAGTPLMVSRPGIALDLPLKLLVWEDTDGRTWITYNAPAFVAARHALPAGLVAPLAAVEAIANAV